MAITILKDMYLGFFSFLDTMAWSKTATMSQSCSSLISYCDEFYSKLL